MHTPGTVHVGITSITKIASVVGMAVGGVMFGMQAAIWVLNTPELGSAAAFALAQPELLIGAAIFGVALLGWELAEGAAAHRGLKQYHENYAAREAERLQNALAHCGASR